MDRQERSARRLLLQSLLSCPHRKLEEATPVFQEALQRDPLFTGKACYALTMPEYNRIRDLEEVAIATLLTSPFAEHREAGRVLFQKLEPYRAGRCAFYIRNSLKKENRQVKGAVEEYLRALEADPKRFDGAVLRARKTLHKLYEFFHIKPAPRAQAILFDDEPPEDSALYWVKALARASDPAEQAQLIVKHKIPLTVATAVMKALTPAVVAALIEVMSPQEAINSRNWLEKGGWLQDERLKQLYLAKLEQATKDERASVAAIKERKSAKGRDAEVEAKLATVAEKKVKTGARITRDTLLCVDISSSMAPAIEVAKRLGSMIAPLCDAALMVICFREHAFPLEVKGEKTLADWEEAFKMVRADGCTSLGAALEAAWKKGFIPEQAIYLTDQQENTGPFLCDVYQRMIQQGHDLAFVFVTVCSRSRQVSDALEQLGARVQVFDFCEDMSRPGWWVPLDQVVPLLAGEGPVSIVDRIMALELPRREQSAVSKGRS